MDKSVKIFLGIVAAGLVAVGALAYFLVKADSAQGKYDEFAACLAEKDAKFYGAFWCQHCQNQKALFGKSVSNLKYIECSNADRTQKQVCVEQKIESYPTWIFADGSRESGELSLASLAEKTGCVLPN